MQQKLPPLSPTFSARSTSAGLSQSQQLASQLSVGSPSASVTPHLAISLGSSTKLPVLVSDANCAAVMAHEPGTHLSCSWLFGCWARTPRSSASSHRNVGPPQHGHSSHPTGVGVTTMDDILPQKFEQSAQGSNYSRPEYLWWQHQTSSIKPLYESLPSSFLPQDGLARRYSAEVRSRQQEARCMSLTQQDQEQLRRGDELSSIAMSPLDAHSNISNEAEDGQHSLSNSDVTGARSPGEVSLFHEGEASEQTLATSPAEKRRRESLSLMGLLSGADTDDAGHHRRRRSSFGQTRAGIQAALAVQQMRRSSVA